MFSRRTAWDRAPNAWTRARARRLASGRPLLDLRSSNPAACDLAWEESTLSDCLRVDGLARHRPEAFGLPAAREAVASWWRARGVPARAEWTCLTASTSEAYGFLFRLLCDPGDAVAVPRPSYPLFDELVGLEALEARPYRLRLDEGRWCLDLESLADTISERTRVVVAVQPNNPTGSRLDEAEARALAALCAERELALISDEVFAEYPWAEEDGSAPRSLLGLAAEESALVFCLSGLSKVAGLPQLKLSWMSAAGPDELVSEALARLEHVADAALSVAAPVQLATDRLLEASAAFRRDCQARLAGNLELLRDSALRVLPGEAGWTAIVELPEAFDEEDLCLRLIEQDGLLTHPGRFFGLKPPGHLVLSLLTPTRDFERGLELLGERLR